MAKTLTRRPCATCQSDTLHEWLTCIHCGTIVELRASGPEIRRKAFLNRLRRRYRDVIAENDGRKSFAASRVRPEPQQDRQGLFGRGRTRTRC